MGNLSSQYPWIPALVGRCYERHFIVHAIIVYILSWSTCIKHTKRGVVYDSIPGRGVQLIGMYAIGHCECVSTWENALGHLTSYGNNTSNHVRHIGSDKLRSCWQLNPVSGLNCPVLRLQSYEHQPPQSSVLPGAVIIVALLLLMWTSHWVTPHIVIKWCYIHVLLLL